MGAFLLFGLIASAIIWACLHFDVAAKIQAHFVPPVKEKDPDEPRKVGPRSEGLK